MYTTLSALVVLTVLLPLLLWRFLSVLPRRGCRAARNPDCKLQSVVVLGSGGHTAEMFFDLTTLAEVWRERFSPTYFVADTDTGSHAKAEDFEKQYGNSPAKVIRVPRAREVGQSYFTSIFTSLLACICSFKAILMNPPDIVFTNGPGTCVPIVCAAYFVRMLGIKHVLVVYSESFACVRHLSVSGNLLYHFADCFTVQWPELLERCPRATYAGRLRPGDLPSLAGAECTKHETATAIVTVGSTQFDSLIRAIDKAEFLDFLQRLKIKRLQVQRGTGSFWPSNLVDSSHVLEQQLEVQVVEYLPDLPTHLRKAALVVSHAGAGTILDCLTAGRRMVVVPNEELMANHQIQLGDALQQRNLLHCFRTGELLQRLQEADFNALCRFPEQNSPVFRQSVCELLGLMPT